MITDDVIAKLDAFAPADETDNVVRLDAILDRLGQLDPALRAPVIPAILGVMERHPEAELGSPGPLVHQLESIPGYESFLRDSVLRQPTDRNIWMANRVLNSGISPDARATWLEVLRAVLKHPLASKESLQAAGHFLKHQGQ